MLPNHRSRHRFAGLALAGVLTTAGLATATVSETTVAAHAASAPSLSVSPNVYVGGQALTWSGSVGRGGIRPLVLQFNMNRPGDTWETVAGFASKTRADGSFRFRHPTPGMFDISYRVNAGGYLSTGKLLHAKTQEVTIQVTEAWENNTNEPGWVFPGQTFGITVDANPEDLAYNPNAQGAPVFKGRVLTLQRRGVGSAWRTLAQTTVGDGGYGSFSGLAEPAGTAAYRVRAEDYFVNGHRIGWTQSFPLYVLSGHDAQSQFATQRIAPSLPPGTVPPAGSNVAGEVKTAAGRYRWGRSLWDFAWEYGESLSSRPARGTNLKGRWVDFSDGAGRVSKHNGALVIESKRHKGAGSGDFGTTRATLVGQPARQGRWEARMQVGAPKERGAADYQILAELVPARAAHYDCGAHNITIASLDPYSRKVRFGVTSPKYRWSKIAFASAPPVRSVYGVAVEVSNKHITWFLNGNPVGTVTAKAARTGVPMTLRLSLVGKGQSEMNFASVISDWQRGYPIASGSKTVTKKWLKRSAVKSGC